jgi:UDP-N-acetylglucosamine--N-acetylmuramyl-(pentapeptide) pyrophosphoryl-undecaprenol N-acetylglucosamine transferase
VYSGNPTRKDLTRADSVGARLFYDIPPDAFVLVVFGGSLGSRAINEAMRSNVSELLQDESLWIIWQTGSQYFKDVKRRVPEHPRLNVLEYIDRMDLTYAAANLAACRSGAITCSELMVTGTPAILIPSPNVAEDHQTHNARAMANAGAAVLVPEAEMESRLANQIAELKSDPTRLRAMSDAGRAIARPEAARDIAEDVLQIARSNSKGPGRRSGSEC